MPGPAEQFRRLRLRLPRPWSLRLARLAYLPKIVSGDEGTRIAFAEEPLIEAIMVGELPLRGVGRGLTERVVEIPWVMRSLPGDPGARVLDVGTAFAPIVYKRMLVRRPERIDALDLAETRLPGIAAHVGDIRALPFADETFDFATCISTLEHIGMDNEHYGIPSGGGADVDGLRELGRVAGRVLVTVPAGADAELGWLRQYTPSTFRARVAEAGLEVHRLEVFAHDAASGWTPVGEDAVSELQFGTGGVYASAAVICLEAGRA